MDHNIVGEHVSLTVNKTTVYIEWIKVDTYPPCVWAGRYGTNCSKGPARVLEDWPLRHNSWCGEERRGDIVGLFWRLLNVEQGMGGHVSCKSRAQASKVHILNKAAVRL